MAKHGSVGEYKPEAEDWTAYTERVGHYFTANDITDDGKKRAIFLSVCGPSTYGLIRSLVAPKTATDLSYTELVELVKKHYNPRPSAITQRFKFNSRVRQPGETVAEYVAALHKLSEHCNFNDTLEDMLRDRLVWDIADSRIQHRLLAEDKLTFTKAQELAQAMELAAKDIKDTQGGATPLPTPVNKVQQGQGGAAKGTKNSLSCYRCGGKHMASRCRFKTEKCRACGKTGHIARMCRTKKKEKKEQQTHTVEEASPPEEYTLYPVVQQQSSSTPLQSTVKLDGKELSMEVDTGASLSLISETTYKKLWESSALPELQPTTVKLRTYTGEEIGVLGCINVKVQTHGQEAQLPLLVVKGKGPSLLGRNWLTNLRLNWQEIFSVRVKQSLESLLKQHEGVFKDELGTLKGMKAKLHVDPQAKPLFYKARTVPFALREQVELELDRLERQDIIAPVIFSDWAAPIVPVEKRDGSVRICGDYKLTVNRVSKTEVYPIPKIKEMFASLAGGKKFSKLDLSHAYQQIQLEEESQKYVTVNTHKGLFQYKRLPFGVASAPALFQRTMESLHAAGPAVIVRLHRRYSRDWQG